MVKFNVRGMFITTMNEAKRFALWSNPHALLVVQRPDLPGRLALKWLVTQHAKSNRISWNAKAEKYRHRSCKTYPTK